MILSKEHPTINNEALVVIIQIYIVLRVFVGIIYIFNLKLDYYVIYSLIYIVYLFCVGYKL